MNIAIGFVELLQFPRQKVLSKMEETARRICLIF